MNAINFAGIYRRTIAAAAVAFLIFAAAGCAQGNGEPSASQTIADESAAETSSAEAPVTSAAPETEQTEIVKKPSAIGAKDGLDLENMPSFEVTSEDLHGGEWDAVISNTDKGQNRSPQLSWQPVDGASCYVIYMVDTTVENWLHWKSANVTGTELPGGWAPADEYVGPYPPGGTHEYEVYVFALKERPAEVKGGLDTQNAKLFRNFSALDTSESGASGNVAAYGFIIGTYTRSE